MLFMHCNYLSMNFRLRKKIKKMQFIPKYFVSGNVTMDYKMMGLQQVIHTSSEKLIEQCALIMNMGCIYSHFLWKRVIFC